MADSLISALQRWAYTYELPDVGVTHGAGTHSFLNGEILRSLIFDGGSAALRLQSQSKLVNLTCTLPDANTLP